ncbi:hypothetical protein [Zavarzinella formosa]|uniref:hypothetical protein n=1 Tax=Zavarzinella formosa TaxID=360055 RepID=UPI000304B16A|nr:hypothetical protein [Zavarzinella formosa]
MTNQEWIDLFRAIPEREHGKTVIVLSNNSEICVDALIRLDANFLSLRGRVGGTIEESRGFIVPFHQVVYVRIERNVKIEEMEAMFGVGNHGGTSAATPTVTASVTPAAALPADPAAASRMLLDKLRASRSTQQGKTSPTQAG